MPETPALHGSVGGKVWLGGRQDFWGVLAASLVGGGGCKGKNKLQVYGRYPVSKSKVEHDRGEYLTSSGLPMCVCRHTLSYMPSFIYSHTTQQYLLFILQA